MVRPALVRYWPEKLTLGATKVRLVQETALWYRENGDTYGMFNSETMTVHIVVENVPRDEIANTIIHELLHVCYYAYNVRSKCGEERTVTALGFALNALFAQNPALLTVLSELNAPS